MSKRRVISLFLAVALIFTLVPVNTVQAQDEVKIRIIHTNDMHGRAKGDELNEKGKVIGFPLLKAFVDQQRDENKNVLVIDAGDTLHGTPLVTLNEGKLMIDLMNDIGYDAMAAGNHDFNYGYERLLALDQSADFPIMAANVYHGEKMLLENNSFTKEFGNVKVGIFGLATEETQTKSSPKNTKGLTFKDDVNTAKEQVEALKAENCDFIICVAHLGVDEESTQTSSRLAENVEGIDLIIDGHSHTVLEKPLVVKDTKIVQTGEYLKNIGVVDITLKGTDKEIESKLVHFKDFLEDGEYGNLKADKVALDKIKNIENENDKVLNEIVGKTEVILEGARKNVRGRETNLGNLLTDAMRATTNAEIAITNGGGIRESIPTSDEIIEPFETTDITRKHIFTAFPFDNIVVTIDVTGQEVLDALNHGTDAYPDIAGKFPQVSGLTYEILVGEPNRVVNVKVGGEALDLSKTYTMATNDFMAIGGDGYEMFGNKEIKGYQGLLSEVLEEYIKEKSPINIDVEGRITEAKEEFERIAGKDRVLTAVEASKSFEKAENAIIASAQNYPDALVAGKLAESKNAPILLVNTLTKEVTDSLNRLGVKNVYIVGGTSSVSEEVEKGLKNLNLEVGRIHGKDRYETANAVAKKGFEKAEMAVLVSGENFPDALSAENISIYKDAPILLTSKNRMTKETEDLIQTFDVKDLVVVGGEQTVAKSVYADLDLNKTVLSGKDRYETALETVKFVRGDMENIVFASGEVFADSLTAGALLKQKEAVLLLTAKDALPKKVEAYMKDHPLKEMTVIGGQQTITSYTGNQAFQLLQAE
ncbi:MAG: cell wall-binding repeat-containing protein [Tissierellia bacterium]|nr:cell wall-binding repeat-containing protein [Tissierellia bacterium]